MKFFCPHCGQRLEAETIRQGTGVGCPACGKGLTTPRKGGSFDPDLEATIVTDEQSSRESADSRPSWPPAFGTDIGEYVLLGELGRGGMGVVYRARQKQLDRLVAVKIVTSGSASSSEDIESFIEEARIAAKARHPNLVGVYGAGEHHGWPYYAMELIEGSSLAEEISDGKPMAPDRAAELMVKVARAVQHLHSLNIVHCDLKPANILLDQKGEPHVTDFGISRTLETLSSTEEDEIVGSPSYMSPEQATGEQKKIGFASDVYSMGAILYQMLTGMRTFDGNSVTEIIDHTIGRSPTPPRRLCRSIPRGLEAICLKCLEKDSAARYASAADLAADLERFLSREPLEAHGPSFLRRFLRWVIREPALAGRFIAMGVFFIVELLWYHVLNISSARFHYAVVAVVPLWAAISYVLQRRGRMRSHRYSDRVFWALTDNIFLSALIYFSDESVCSPVVVCYPIIIAGSGMWHRVSLVRLSTAMSMLFYGLLWLEAFLFRPEVVGSFDRHVVFLIGLYILSLLVGNMAKQIEILSSRDRL